MYLSENLWISVTFKTEAIICIYHFCCNKLLLLCFPVESVVFSLSYAGKKFFIYLFFFQFIKIFILVFATFIFMFIILGKASKKKCQIWAFGWTSADPSPAPQFGPHYEVHFFYCFLQIYTPQNMKLRYGVLLAHLIYSGNYGQKLSNFLKNLEEFLGDFYFNAFFMFWSN